MKFIFNLFFLGIFVAFYVIKNNYNRHACMILGFNKHAWGKHNLFIKLGGGTMGFIGEILGRAKGLRYLIYFSLSWVCFFLWVSMGIRSG
jgi:hypothetical protein